MASNLYEQQSQASEGPRGTPPGVGYGRSFISPFGTFRMATGYLGQASPGMGQVERATPSLYADDEGRHLGGANYAFADGHVKWLRGALVSSGYHLASPNQRPTTTQGVWNAAGTERAEYAATWSAY